MKYNINFETGKLEPIKTSDKDNLPVGTVLQLNGYSNPRKELGHALTSGQSDNYGNLPGLDRDGSQKVYRQARTIAV